MNSPVDLRSRNLAREETREAIKSDQQRNEEDLRFVMGTVSGRRFMWWTLEQAGLYRTSFTGNSTTFFNEGMRNMGLILVNAIHAACPDQYAVMVKEAQTNKDRQDG